MSFFSHAENIFTWADMVNTEPSSPLGSYILQLREWGFNGLALYADPEKNPAAMRAFATHLMKNGIGLIIRREWLESETSFSWPISASDAKPRISSDLCPYNDDVRSYWEQRVTRDFNHMPDLRGYRMNGTEFYFINGAPWMCDCSKCRSMTPRERVIDAICFIAGLLRKHGATLFWETCQDDPWGQRQEAYYFSEIIDELPDNAFIVMKEFYWDFHPGWPEHPLVEKVKRSSSSTERSPYITSIQQPGEYQGVHDFPWCMVDDWSGTFQNMVTTGQQGVWVMSMVTPDGWDHPLNMVNWYAISCYMKEPKSDPYEIKCAWAQESFGKESVPVVLDLMERITEAARGTYEFDALWTANHSRFPSLEYLDSHMCGPLRQFRRMAGMMGLALPLDMYSVDRAAEIRSNVKTRMVFNQLPITSKLKAETMAQKERAEVLMEQAISLWQSLEDKIDHVVYQNILSGLEGNRNDTIIFRHMMDIYMDWKLGVLTEAKIDYALEACQGMQGVAVPDPLDDNPTKVTIVEPATLKTFAEQLRQDLRTPWVEKYWSEIQKVPALESLWNSVPQRITESSRFSWLPSVSNHASVTNVPPLINSFTYGNN